MPTLATTARCTRIPEEYLRARDRLRAVLTPDRARELRRLQAPDASIDDLLTASRFVRATVVGERLLPGIGELAETHPLWMCLLEHALSEN